MMNKNRFSNFSKVPNNRIEVFYGLAALAVLLLLFPLGCGKPRMNAGRTLPESALLPPSDSSQKALEPSGNARSQQQGGETKVYGSGAEAAKGIAINSASQTSTAPKIQVTVNSETSASAKDPEKAPECPAESLSQELRLKIKEDEVLLNQDIPAHPCLSKNQYIINTDTLKNPTTGKLTLLLKEMKFNFEPPANWHGTVEASFETKQVIQGSGAVPPLKVKILIEVEPVEDLLKVSQKTEIQLNEDSWANIEINQLGQDGDGTPFGVVLVTLPQNGTLEKISETALKYTPMNNWSGNETVEFYLVDKQTGAQTERAALSFKVNEIDDAPQFTTNALLTLTHGDKKDFDLRTYISDPDLGQTVQFKTFTITNASNMKCGKIDGDPTLSGIFTLTGLNSGAENCQDEILAEATVMHLGGETKLKGKLAFTTLPAKIDGVSVAAVLPPPTIVFSGQTANFQIEANPGTLDPVTETLTINCPNPTDGKGFVTCTKSDARKFSLQATAAQGYSGEVRFEYFILRKKVFLTGAPDKEQTFGPFAVTAAFQPPPGPVPMSITGATGEACMDSWLDILDGDSQGSAVTLYSSVTRNGTRDSKCRTTSNGPDVSLDIPAASGFRLCRPIYLGIKNKFSPNPATRHNDPSTRVMKVAEANGLTTLYVAFDDNPTDGAPDLDANDFVFHITFPTGRIGIVNANSVFGCK